MRHAIAVACMLLGTAVLAATNATERVVATNAVAVASKKEPRPSRSQCKATTLSGNRCKRHAAQGSVYCSQHEAIARKRGKKPKR